MPEPIAIFLGTEQSAGPLLITGAWKLSELGYYILSNDYNAIIREVGWPLPTVSIEGSKLNGGVVFPIDNQGSWIVVAPELEYTCRINGYNFSGAIEYVICKNCGVESKGRYICSECGQVFDDMINAHIRGGWRVIK
jgi:hypothetical protein